jgi:hypothetical protein
VPLLSPLLLSTTPPIVHIIPWFTGISHTVVVVVIYTTVFNTLGELVIVISIFAIKYLLPGFYQQHPQVQYQVPSTTTSTTIFDDCLHDYTDRYL